MLKSWRKTSQLALVVTLKLLLELAIFGFRILKRKALAHPMQRCRGSGTLLLGSDLVTTRLLDTWSCQRHALTKRFPLSRNWLERGIVSKPDRLHAFFNKADFVLFRCFILLSGLAALLKLLFGIDLTEFFHYWLKR